jgi:putative oxidoreductase
VIGRNSTAWAHGANSLRAALERLGGVGRVLAPIALRLALATPFFRSGMTRWDGFLSLSPSTTYLFEEEFKLHLFGGQYSFPWPDLVAHVVATAEITLPILLVLGLATRFAGLALLVMTGVIELVVPDGWANFHIHWAAEAIAITAFGPGPLSMDRAIQRLWLREAMR